MAKNILYDVNIIKRIRLRGLWYLWGCVKNDAYLTSDFYNEKNQILRGDDFEPLNGFMYMVDVVVHLATSGAELHSMTQCRL